MRWLRVTMLLTVLLTGVMIYPQTPPQTIKAALEARLVELQQGRDQAMANVNAYNGAIQECQHWLDWLDKQGTSSNKSKQPAP